MGRGSQNSPLPLLACHISVQPLKLFAQDLQCLFRPTKLAQHKTESLAGLRGAQLTYSGFDPAHPRNLLKSLGKQRQMSGRFAQVSA